MGGMHDFRSFWGAKIMHTTEKIAKNHAYRHKRYRGAAKITHTTAFDAAMFSQAIHFAFSDTEMAEIRTAGPHIYAGFPLLHKPRVCRVRIPARFRKC